MNKLYTFLVVNKIKSITLEQQINNNSEQC